MKVIIAGSRDITHEELLLKALSQSSFEITEVVCGMARGADKLGYYYALETGRPVATFPAEWDRLGKSAGYVRNGHMGDYADALIALWDGESKGTKHMIEYMKKLNKPVEVYIIKKEST